MRENATIPIAFMKITERSLRIGASCLLALLFIGVAYVLSGPSFLSRKTAEAGSTEELLKAYAQKDTDGDNLPDWQEALYGTDPKKADTDGDGMSDGEAARQGKLTPNALSAQLPSGEDGAESVQDALDDIPGVDPAPGSITEQFSHEFLEEYLQASGGQPMDAEAQQTLIAGLVASFSDQAGKLFKSSYTAVSIHTDTSVTIAQYAGAIENVLKANDVSDEMNDPLPLMEALIENNDESARPKLEKLARAYKAIAEGLLAVHVPPQLSSQHLALVQSFDELYRATQSVASYEEDPLGVMGAISIYQPASKQVVSALKDIATSILTDGEPAAGTPGAVIVNFARSTEAI